MDGFDALLGGRRGSEAAPTHTPYFGPRTPQVLALVKAAAGLPVPAGPRPEGVPLPTSDVVFAVRDAALASERAFWVDALGRKLLTATTRAALEPDAARDMLWAALATSCEDLLDAADVAAMLAPWRARITA